MFCFVFSFRPRDEPNLTAEVSFLFLVVSAATIFQFAKRSFSDGYISHQRSGGQRRQRGEGRGRGRGEGRGRGRGERNKPNIVQSSSIFSMGVGSVEKQRVGKRI